MKNSSISVENYINFYLSRMTEILEGEDNGRKLIVCALLGFQPWNIMAKEFALWWETAPDEDLEEGFIDLKYSAYETDDEDGFTWALMTYLLIGLYNFRFQHTVIIKDGVVGDTYKDMVKAFDWGINHVPNTHTYQATMRELDKITRKMGRRRLKRTFRRRHCACKR